MNQQQANDSARQFISQLHRVEAGDSAAIDGLAAMFTDDAQISNPLIERHERESHTRVGRDAVAAFWREYCSTFGAVHSEFYQVTTGDRAAGLFWRSDGQDPRGQPFAYEGVTLLTFDDSGKIARFKSYFDPGQVTLRAQH